MNKGTERKRFTFYSLSYVRQFFFYLKITTELLPTRKRQKKMEKYDRISNMKSSSCTCVVRCDEDLTTFHLMFFFSFVFFSLGPFFSYFTCSVLIWISTSPLFYSDFYGGLVDGFPLSSCSEEIIIRMNKIRMTKIFEELQNESLLWWIVRKDLTKQTDRWLTVDARVLSWTI